MKIQYMRVLENLPHKGWHVQLQPTPKAVPAFINLRYDWIPTDLRSFVEVADSVVSPDEKSWFITSREISSDSEAAFSWNQWEIDSLEAAGNNLQWKQKIWDFWDNHFTIMMSLKSGYAFFAIQKSDLAIVQGEEPVYEATTKIAGSFLDFLKSIQDGDPRLERWI